jgi:hypothetical protein
VPGKKPRQPEHEVGHPLDQREGERGLRRDPHQVPEQHQAAVLHAEAARNRKGGAADGIGQAFDDRGLRQAHRVSHQRERNQDFERADQPPGHVHGGGDEDPSGVAPDRVEAFVQS